MSTLFLCGFMGCGKTTVGALLAKEMGCNCIDMDAYIVEQAGKSIPEIFAEDGEPAFRQMEAEAIVTLAQTPGVIACGGGAMLPKENADRAKQNGGTVVYLDVPFETCYARIAGDTNRPLVQQNTKEQLEEIYNARVVKYKANASVTIQATGTPAEIVQTILKTV